MPNDLSRTTFSTSKHFVGVRLQQGRVQLDADSNEVTDRILRYLHATPNAADTLDGIVEWWLCDCKSRTPVPRIKRTLAQLVRRGLLLKQKASDGQTHYRLNRRNIQPPAKPSNPLPPATRRLARQLLQFAELPEPQRTRAYNAWLNSGSAKRNAARHQRVRKFYSLMQAIAQKLSPRDRASLRAVGNAIHAKAARKTKTAAKPRR